MAAGTRMMDDEPDPAFAAAPPLSALPVARRRRGWLLPLLLATLAFAGGIALAGYAIHRWDRVARLVRPQQAEAAVPVAPLPVRIVAQPAQAAAPDPALAERLGRIEGQIAEISSRAAEASGDADRAEGLLVAFAARRALDRGQPMGFLEPLLRRHFGGSEPQAVATIIAAGQRPVTLVQLEQGFDDISPALTGPARNESWWSTTRRELGTLFVIRKGGERPNLPVDRLGRAEKALALGRVDVALDEVARLPGAGDAGAWMASARRYAVARNALDRIETAALLAPDPATAPLPAATD